jgi:hypothetical protein
LLGAALKETLCVIREGEFSGTFGGGVGEEKEVAPQFGSNISKEESDIDDWVGGGSKEHCLDA